MAVQEQTPLQEYTANGITKQFDLEFDCESADHLIVSIDDLEVLHTDWYLSGNAIMFHIAPANGKQVKIQRNTPFNRLADYQSYNNSFRPPVINKDFDRIWWKLQELGVADWILSNRINALKTYVDDRDDELRAYLMEEIHKQGVSLDQLDDYYNYLMQRLAQIAVDKGWDASFVVDGEENQRQINSSLIRTVKTPNELLLIQNPKNKQIIHVESIQKTFIYDVNLTAADNGVTVIGKWEMEAQDAYYASWFCEAESGVDESVKLQTGYDYAVSKKRAFIIDIKVDVNPTNATKTALWIRSNSVLGFVGGGEMRMLANSATGYDLIRVEDVENYVIKYPVLRGDRLTHTGTSGEWGYGLTIYQSKNGYIHKPRIYDMWGDGLYVGRQWGLINSNTPTNVTIFEPYIEGVRRNGISFTAGDNVNIIRPYVTKVGDHDGVDGTWPKAGIDIEPEQAAGTPLSSIVNSRITSATIKDCFSSVLVYLFSSDLHHTLTFDGVTTIDGATNTPLGLYHGGSNCTGLISFEHVLVKSSYYVGMLHGWNGASAIKCVIDRLTVLSAANFILKHTLRGDYAEKVLGNLFVNNVTSNGSVTHMFEEDVDGYIIGNVFRRGVNHKGNFVYYGGKALNYAPGFMFDGVQTHSSWSASTRVYPNTIWQNPSIDTAGTTPIFLNTSGDYRRLKVGLSNTSQIVGQGCNIQGLNLLVGGVAKTKARCSTLGGWLDFQNVEGGRTIIYGSYGEWTFS